MTLSRYLKIWPCPDRPGHVILYSTKKGSVVRLPDARLAAAREGTLSDKEQEALRRLEILIDDPAAEQEAMTTLVARTNIRGDKFTAKIVLNLDCNLACPYCFEGHFRESQYMTGDTARLLVDFIIRNHVAAGREIAIGFYGGEPLLSVPLLTGIALPLREACAARGVPFSFTLTSNGTLLTRKTVEELLPLGFSGAFITLDGPRETHDRQRPFISGKGSYDRIIANIKEVCDLVKIHPGGNYSRDSYREFPRLLDDLITEGITPERVGFVEFAPIMPKSGKGGGHDSAGMCCSGSEPWVMEAAPFLREEIMKRGFTTTKPSMAACVIEFENNLVVNYDGSLFKCPAFMGWPELSVGTLESGIKDYRQSHNLDVWKNDQCLDCAYLPLCFGGCRLFTLMKNGAIDGVDCRKGYYDAVLKELVLQDLRYGRKT